VIEDINKFIKKIPMKERDLCFKEFNLLPTLSIIDFQVSSNLGLAPIGIPRYINDKVVILQFNKVTYLSNKNVF